MSDRVVPLYHPRTIPVFELNTPHGGAQRPISIPDNEPIYSTYTGELAGNGFIP